MKEKFPAVFALLEVEEMQMSEGGAFLNEGLLQLIGKPTDEQSKDSLIFPLPSYEMCNKAVKRWVKRAGI